MMPDLLKAAEKVRRLANGGKACPACHGGYTIDQTLFTGIRLLICLECGGIGITPIA